MKFVIFMILLSVLAAIKNADAMSIGNFLNNPLDLRSLNVHQLFPHDRKLEDPIELVRISIKRLTMDDEDEVNSDENLIENFNYFNCQQMNATDLEGKQIPVISDIERIKKVVQIIEFVGEKVGELIDKIDVPASSYDTRQLTENGNDQKREEEIETQTE